MAHSTTIDPPSGCLDGETIAACCDAAGAPFPAHVLQHIEECDACRRAVAAAVLAQRGRARRPTTVGFVGPWLAHDTVAGRYRLERVVGVGGMGIVCLATDLRLRRAVALKVLRGDGTADRARLQHESRMMARLRHPNVVTVYDVGEHHGHTYVAMAYVDGGTLRSWSTARTNAEILVVLHAAGRGLAAAHAVGVIHRDFKPDNVLVAADGRVQVTDFGLAESTGTASSHDADDDLAETRAITRRAPAGTPAFMAPEQLDGAELDARTDVFAFCVTAWGLLCGAPPFAGRTTTELRAAMDGGPTWTGARAVSPSLRRVLARGLAVDPAQRPATMDVLLHALVDRPRRWSAGAAVFGSVAVVAALQGTPSTCPELDAADDRWADTHGALLDRIDRAVAVDAAVLEQAQRQHVAWRSGLVQWCEHVDVPQADRAAAHRCLHDDELELAALLELVGRTPADTERVSMAIDRLPIAARCATADARARPWPGDPQLAGAVDELRDALVHARVVHVGGDHEAARRELEALRSDPALGFEPAKAELQLALAETALDAADPVAGPALLQDAIVVALAAGHDAVAIEAWLALSRSSRQSGGDPQRGSDFLARAEAALDRLGRPADLVAEVALARGEAAQLEGHEALARAALTEAIDASMDGSPLRFDALHTLANLEAGIGAVHDAIAVHETLLAQRQARFGARSIPAARSHLALGSAYGRVGQWQRSADEAGLVAEIVESSLGPDHWWIAMALHNRADALRHTTGIAEALVVQRRALAIAEVALPSDSPIMARMQRGEATLLRDMGALDRAIPMLVAQCDEITRTLRVHADVGDCALDLAVAQLRADRLDDALVSIERALASYDATIGPDAEPMGRARSIAGQILRRSGDLDRAHDELARAVEILDAADVDPGWLGHTLAELERTRVARGEPSSRERRDRALALLATADPLWAAQRAAAADLRDVDDSSPSP